MLCPYKNIFGKPNEGFHSARIGPYALNDTVGTIALSGVISYTLKTDFIPTLVSVFIIAEVSHYAFCVDTAFINQVFGRPRTDRI